MKKIVSPHTWSTLYRVEHPPLMMKQLFQGVCGGLRWLETKDMAEYIARRAVEDGHPVTKAEHKALGATTRYRKPKRSPTLRNSKSVFSKSNSGKELALNNSLVTSSNALAVLGGPKKRLITYDVLDCTFGSGYHTGAILENGRPYTRVVALDCDLDARVATDEILREFGSQRFRFFTNKMSEIKSMFGEGSFDAVMIDPGPSLTQQEDPSRGFTLDDESEHAFDMRYSCRSGLSTLEYINTVPQHALARALSSYGLLTPPQSMKLARAIRVHRPFHGSRKLLEIVEREGNELPEDGWMTQSSRRKSPMSWKFLTSLRCVVNDEYNELNEALLQSFLVLRENGRLVVFTYLSWEENLVKKIVEEHPHALLSYSEAISIEDVQSSGQTRHTKMWVVTKVKQSSFLLKNSENLTREDIRESSVRWLNGMFAGQTHGFPANNFTFENKDPKERKIERQNNNPPPFDDDSVPPPRL